MSKVFAVAALAVLLFAGSITSASAAGGGASASPLTIAVDGDLPYGKSNADTEQFDALPAYIQTINADPDVGLALHVGDIHSGKQYCTEAYDRSIFDAWKSFDDPIVYTPGDNEWTDCHKSKEGGGLADDYAFGNPVANLGLIRSIFFPVAGTTLGAHPMHVVSQAQWGPRGRTTDANYVENVMWEQANTLFVTLNIPGGSNNDADPWFGAAQPTQEQRDEIRQRTAADLHWINDAYAQAARHHVGAVVIGTQADMWDLDGSSPDHIAGYEPFIARIASKTADFGKPVLLFNGDSHLYRSDNPLVAGAPCVIESGAGTTDCPDDAHANHDQRYNVPNFHRVVVHGSTAPMEWLKFAVRPGSSNDTTSTSFGPFSWSRQITNLPTP